MVSSAKSIVPKQDATNQSFEEMGGSSHLRIYFATLCSRCRFCASREGHEIEELAREREEWNAVLAEPDGEGPVEDETDDED